MRLPVILGLSALWFGHSLQRNIELGYDFKLYLDGPSRHDWFYPEYVSYLFEPFRWVPFDLAFLIYYAICVVAWFSIAKRLGWWWWLTIYPALLILESANVTLILAAISLSPIGALVAVAVKPYCVVFVLLHAYRAHLEGTSYWGRRALA